MNPATPEITYDDLRRWAIGSRRLVVLVGYSGAGYRAPASLERTVRALVREAGAHTLFVAGATPEGIGTAYPLIRQESERLGLAGVKTAGLVSALAKGRALADGVDGVCYVPSANWEVTLPNGCSATVDILRGCIDPLLVALGGGLVAGKEVIAAIEREFPVRLYCGPGMRPLRPVPGLLDPETGALSPTHSRLACEVLSVE